jgi:hypothetical protein
MYIKRSFQKKENIKIFDYITQYDLQFQNVLRSFEKKN